MPPCKALVEQLGQPGESTGAVESFPGMVSAADLRHLKEILADFGLQLHLAAGLFRNDGWRRPGRNMKSCNPAARR